MEVEVAQHIGAERYERSGERNGQRNGYRDRTWDTRVGTLDSTNKCATVSKHGCLTNGGSVMFGPEYGTAPQRSARRVLADSSDEKWEWDEHTGAKHAVLVRYLKAWMPIFG